MAAKIALLSLVLVLGIVLIPHVTGPSLDGVEPPRARLADENLIENISQGEEVDLEQHLRPGVWTIVEFTADW